jgi:hypothetical protein
MALITCPECGNTVSDLADICPRCGYPRKKKITPSESKSGNGCATFFGVVFVIAGFFFWPLWILAVLLFILSAVSKK